MFGSSNSTAVAYHPLSDHTNSSNKPLARILRLWYSAYHFGTLVAPCLIAFIAGVFLSQIFLTTSLHLTDSKPREASIPKSSIPNSIFSPAIPKVLEPDKGYLGWNKLSNQNWHHLTQRAYQPIESASSP